MAMPRRTLPTVALLHYTAPPVLGGVEQIVARQARLLAAEGFEVRVITGRAQAIGGGVRLQRVPLADSRHRRVMAVTHQLEDGRAGPAFDTLSSQLEDALGRALKGVDICLAHNVLTLHKNLALTAALHRLAASTPALRIVAWCHDLAWTNPQYRPALHRGRPWTLLTTPVPGATYVAVSRERQRQIAQALGLPLAQIEVIPNAVDPAAVLHLTPATRWLADTLRLFDQQIVLLLPARITRRKRIEYALRVVAELSRRELAVRLLVTGPPGPHNPRNLEYLTELRALRHALGVDEQVVFCRDLPGPDGHGFVPSDRVMADLYALSDALLLPSLEEGFGLPLLEAAVFRTPVFATSLGPFREIGGDAIQMFGLDDTPAACARQIVHALMDDRAYRLRRRVLGTYRWDVVMRDRILPLLLQRVPAPRR